MKRLNQKPVIFLAFANDRVRENAYLRNLPEELRGIRKELEKAVEAGLCEIVERANATIGEILDMFQDAAYKDRIAVFHFGGHADSYKLLCEDFAGGPTSVYKEGLASFLAGQKGLQLIFLNACSTGQHAQELRKVGIPAVIGTSQPIGDQVAFLLATRFYHGLANGSGIERAWREAVQEMEIRVGPGNSQALYQDNYAGDTDRFPWDILYKEGADKVKEWNLPDAAHNPLFGLPPIPDSYTLPDPPFLFLDRFTGKQAKIFFGRSYYTRALYDRVTDGNAAPIIFLYGQSGVGKSSLLEAGLLPRLEESLICIYIRKKQDTDLLRTLEECLRRKGDLLKNRPWTPQNFCLEAPSSPDPSHHSSFIIHHSNPPLIILDQVEELFTRPDELDDFMEMVKSVFGNVGDYPNVKLILGFRKEYYPEMEALFKKHALPRYPVYLQPLNREDIIEVVTGLTSTRQLKDYYRLEVEEGLAEIIADDLLEDSHSPVAPTLQILLTKMWAAAKKEDFSPRRQFTIELYRELKREGLLMEDFFKQQMAKVENWKEEAVHSGLALDLLKFHTTPLGTSASRDLQQVRQAYKHRMDIIDSLLEKLKEAYLLTDTHDRENASETGLAHDTLAPIVIKEYNESDKPGQRAARILAAKLGIEFSRHPEEISGILGAPIVPLQGAVADRWPEGPSRGGAASPLLKKFDQNFLLSRSETPPLLDDADLKIVEEGQKGMKALTPEETRLLEESRKHKARKDRMIRAIKITGGVLIGMVILIGLVAMWQWDKASRGEKRATANFYATRAQLMAGQDPTDALGLAEQALKMDANPMVKETIYKIYRENIFYQIIAEQTDAITALAVSPDGSKVVAGSPDGVVFIWGCRELTLATEDTEGTERVFISSSPGVANLMRNCHDYSGKILRTFKAHTGSILAAAFSPGGNQILTGSMDGSTRLWNLEGKQIMELPGQGGFVLTVAFSPDGRYILTGSVDKTARLWDRQGQLKREFKGHKGRVLCTVFSPDSKYILTGSSDGTARLWDLAGHQIRVFDEPGCSITSTAFSPDGKSVAIACDNGKVFSLDITWNLKKTGPIEYPGHNQRVTSVSFSPDGLYILASSADKTARLWEVNGTPVQVLKGHKDSVVSAAFSPGGQYVFTASADKTLRLWALKGRMVTIFDGHQDRVYDVAFSPDGSRVLTGSRDRTARLWDLHGKPLCPPMFHDSSVLTAGFSLDGKGIFTRTENGNNYWWDLKGNPLHGLTNESNSESNIASSAVIAPKRKYRFTCLPDGTVQLFDSEGNHFQTLTGHKGNVNAVAFSPDGKYILTGSFDNTARLYEIHLPLQDFASGGSGPF